jgi:hypothetical protein
VGAGIDEAVGSLDALLEMAARDEAAGLPDAPWPPHYEKQTGEAPRVQPSKRRTSAGSMGGAKSKAAGDGASGADAAADAAADPAAGTGEQAAVRPAAPGKSSGASGRRRTSMPLIEVARAATKAEAEAGLDRWKQRHPEAAAALEPADILVDSMRGRSSTWTRIRLNLRHVPEDQRPPQEELEVDYDPWRGATPPRRSANPT